MRSTPKPGPAPRTESCEVCGVWKIDAGKIDEVRRGLPKPSRVEREAGAFKALGHPSRLLILHALSIRECCVCEISRILGQPVSTVSQHLCRLRTGGWIKSRQRGKLVIYTLEAAGRRALGGKPDGTAL